MGGLEVSLIDLLNTGGIAGVLLIMLFLFVRGTILPTSVLKDLRNSDKEAIKILSEDIAKAIENGLAKGIASAVHLAADNPGHGNPDGDEEEEEVEE